MLAVALVEPVDGVKPVQAAHAADLARSSYQTDRKPANQVPPAKPEALANEVPTAGQV